jgi:topoisomerase-4 subunit A
MIDREPVTIVCSKMGWIRAMTGHLALDKVLKYKDGDEARFMFHAETTDKLIAFGSNGRFFYITRCKLAWWSWNGRTSTFDDRPA